MFNDDFSKGVVAERGSSQYSNLKEAVGDFLKWREISRLDGKELELELKKFSEEQRRKSGEIIGYAGAFQTVERWYQKAIYTHDENDKLVVLTDDKPAIDSLRKWLGE